jgi:hypothetical protein
MNDPTCIYDLLDALNAAIGSADPVKRAQLSSALDNWGRDNVGDAAWAFGLQAPWLLRSLLIEIDMASMPASDHQVPKPTLRVV